MKTKIKDLMGKIVTVAAITKRDHVTDDATKIVNAVCIDKPITPRAGWVVGIRYLKTGIFHCAKQYNSYGSEGEFEPAYTEVLAVVPLYQVVFWPTMKPVNVRPENFSAGGTPISPNALMIQAFKDRNPTGYERWVKSIRDDIKAAPRNHGKFIKAIPT